MGNRLSSKSGGPCVVTALGKGQSNLNLFLLRESTDYLGPLDPILML